MEGSIFLKRFAIYGDHHSQLLVFMTRSGDFVLVCNFLLSSSYLITDRTSAAAAAGSASSGLSEIEVAEDDNKTDCSDQLLDADEGLTEGET